MIFHITVMSSKNKFTMPLADYFYKLMIPIGYIGPN